MCFGVFEDFCIDFVKGRDGLFFCKCCYFVVRFRSVVKYYFFSVRIKVGVRDVLGN